MAELDFRELQKLAAEILGVDPEQVQMNVSFQRDLAADSLDLVELIAAVEDKYDVELSESAPMPSPCAPSGPLGARSRSPGWAPTRRRGSSATRTWSGWSKPPTSGSGSGPASSGGML